MEGGRRANLDTKMKGSINVNNVMTDIYLPRKCDYTDRIINSKDHSSIQLNINDVNNPLFRSRTMALSTTARPTSLLFAGSLDQWVREMPPCKRCSTKSNSSDLTSIATSSSNNHSHVSCDGPTLLKSNPGVPAYSSLQPLLRIQTWPHHTPPDCQCFKPTLEPA